MGGLILILLLGVAVAILVTPALRARARKRREEVEQAAHEAVIQRLADHRKRRTSSSDDVIDG